jgi:hypothetical protein
MSQSKIQLDQVCWFRKATHCAIGIRLNPRGDRGVQLVFCIPWLINLWVGLHFNWLNARLPECKSSMNPGETFTIPEERNIEITIHHGSIWFHLWQRANEWRAKDPWWWSFSWNAKDFFLGMPSYESKVLEELDVKIPLPEKTYTGTAQLCVDTWKRPRWPWPHSLERIRFNYGKDGIPIPGKGENSWDCGETARTGSTVAEPHSELYRATYEQSVHIMKTRWKYGGFGWLPEGYRIEQESTEESQSAVEAAIDATFDQAWAELHELMESPTREQIFDRATDILLCKLGDDLSPDYPIEAVDQELRDMGVDPDELGQRGEELVQGLLAEQDDKPLEDQVGELQYRLDKLMRENKMWAEKVGESAVEIDRLNALLEKAEGGE